MQLFLLLQKSLEQSGPLLSEVKGYLLRLAKLNNLIVSRQSLHFFNKVKDSHVIDCDVCNSLDFLVWRYGLYSDITAPSTKIYDCLLGLSAGLSSIWEMEYASSDDPEPNLPPTMFTTMST